MILRRFSDDVCHRAAAAALFCMCTVWLAAAGGAAAATGRWTAQEIVPGAFAEARLIAAVDGTGGGTALPAGLQLRLEEGWKTYWRSPGDAGLPPRVDWSGSGNVAAVRFAWPAPHRFTLFGIETFGYGGEVVFPLTVVPERPGEPVALRGTADLLVCSDLCVPVRIGLALDLPAGPAGVDGAAANLIDRSAGQVPGDGRAAGLAIARVAAGQDGRSLQVEATAREPFAAPDIFVESADGLAFAAPRITLAEGGRRLTAELAAVPQPTRPPAPLAGRTVTLTLVDGPRAMEHSAAVAPAAAAGTGLAAMLGAALLGGLILNLMPCVLPVLSLKLLSVLGQGGRAPRRVRLGFLASAAGIVTSFLVLAAAAIAVRAGGGAVGWGIQFQQPLFLAFMIVLLTLFAANLLGLFEIVLPWRMADAAGRAGSGEGLAGHFATGAFATLLATPCSAPFLGTAVGFALSRGPVEIVAVFLALGVGLALPYLLVAAVPRLATRLPRPGRWMVRLRQILSLALIATALWLLSVLAVQDSPAAALAVGGLMAALGLVLWGRTRLAGGRARFAGGAAGAGLALAALLVPVQPGGSAAPVPAAERAGSVRWTPFDPAAIAGRVAAGEVVFVDVTADWCLTCQANTLLVLDRGRVAAALAGAGVVPMRADWTRPDERIAAYLARHGRYGIPFYAVYGPAAPDGITLPELLTEDAVVQAFTAAGLDSAGRRPQL